MPGWAIRCQSVPAMSKRGAVSETTWVVPLTWAPGLSSTVPPTTKTATSRS